ncbi:probable ADP-ribosylation factor GTPase-activating protein AGD14 isoform X2 [Asparagus officinalis]|uniref:probable ADP-ribosylation factor GTPase-activating protein AGD14 isoform X2 n=1 Tax=Asparagus officinalis TaxID=4686 RepID=UPI00098E2693|nr:probable ADP-ribosylation factor GTPase-activating protein AGD14 isoform X2 [Asparagus officinalis]
MMSKKEEERNEKIIRGLIKLPPNSTCINCNSRGPQYVCTNFWTFVCVTCSGIHREFTHRVKSVSMAKFTTQEVQALQKGGNQRARDIFFKSWDMQSIRFPNNSNADKIREFINDVYIHKKYANEGSSGKLPSNMEKLNINEENGIEASSHHSSQNPQHQHEDNRIGRSPIIKLSESQVLDQGFFDRIISGAVDYVANENSSSNFSDHSVTSNGDPLSPYSQDVGDISPELVKENVERNSNERFCHKRTVSSGGFESSSRSLESFRSTAESFLSTSESFVTASESFRSHSGSFLMNDDVGDTDLNGAQKTPVSTSMNANDGDLFGDICDDKPSVSGNDEEWATFDEHDPFGFLIERSERPETKDKDNSQWFSFPNSVYSDPFLSSSNQLEIDLQSWQAFKDSFENKPQNVFENLDRNNQLHIPVNDLHSGLQISEVLEKMVHPGKSRNPFDLPYDLDPEADNKFFDMSSLQTTIPFPGVPTPQQWSPQSSNIQGVPYVETQEPSSMFSNAQGTSTSRHGNPFA